MAFIQCDFFSEVLGLSCSMNVLLPQRTSKQVGMDGAQAKGPTPVLYLLHGWSDDHSIWMRRTSIERYVAPYGLAVVMPAVNKSSYSNMAYGLRYWDFISEEVPALARQFFSLSDKREDNYVAGLSMGGFGAMKMLFNHPDRFSAGGTFSGSVGRCDDSQEVTGERYFIVGDEKREKTLNDIHWLAEENIKQGKPMPRVYQSCGTEDFLFEKNQQFRERMEELKYDFTVDFRPGTHEWGFWDTDIKNFLEWLDLKQPGEEQREE